MPADRTLPPHSLSRRGLSVPRTLVPPCCPWGRTGKGGQGDFYGTLHTFETCGNACRTGRVLTSSYEHVSPGLARGKMVNLGNRFLDTSPSSRKTQVFSTIIRLSSGRFFYDDVRNSLLDRRQKFLTSRNLIEIDRGEEIFADNIIVFLIIYISRIQRNLI